MNDAPGHAGITRLIFMGEPALTDGFRLIGFETWADPSVQEIEKLMRELVNKRHNALVVIDQGLADADIPIFKRVRSEGGHIIITTVPPLAAPDSLHGRIDAKLEKMLSAANLGQGGGG
jgi:vacuolar-type H+-ATPase subunit F/Vma7